MGLGSGPNADIDATYKDAVSTAHVISCQMPNDKFVKNWPDWFMYVYLTFLLEGEDINPRAAGCAFGACRLAVTNR
jgi:hypothetical protein